MTIRNIIFLLMLFPILCFAAEFEVVSFTKDPSDLSARKFPRKDINNEDCALIKVRGDVKGLQFDSNMGIAGNIEYKDGEYWVYVTPYERIIEIYRDGFTKLTFVSEVIIEPATVYVLVIRIKDNEVTIKVENDNVIEELETCSGSIIDKRNGMKYRIVEIGNQCWMGENLNYNAFASYCYKNLTSYCDLYGRLYKYKSAITACPKGWHLPSNDEWDTLLNALEKDNGEDDKIQVQNEKNDNMNNNDRSGISFLYAGFKFPKSRFRQLGKQSYFWSQTEFNLYDSWCQIISCKNKDVKRENLDKDYGFSVRCVRDN